MRVLGKDGVVKLVRDINRCTTLPSTNEASSEKISTMLEVETRGAESMLSKEFIEFWDELIELSEDKERAILCPFWSPFASPSRPKRITPGLIARGLPGSGGLSTPMIEG